MFTLYWNEIDFTFFYHSHSIIYIYLIIPKSVLFATAGFMKKVPSMYIAHYFNENFSTHVVEETEGS